MVSPLPIYFLNPSLSCSSLQWLLELADNQELPWGMLDPAVPTMWGSHPWPRAQALAENASVSPRTKGLGFLHCNVIKLLSCPFIVASSTLKQLVAEGRELNGQPQTLLLNVPGRHIAAVAAMQRVPAACRELGTPLPLLRQRDPTTWCWPATAGHL